MRGLSTTRTPLPQNLLSTIPDSRHFGGFLVGSFFFLNILPD